MVYVGDTPLTGEGQKKYSPESRAARLCAVLCTDSVMTQISLNRPVSNFNVSPCIFQFNN